MNTVTRDTIMFIIGAAVGSFVTWKMLDSKYEARYRDDVESVKRAFSKRNANPAPENINNEVTDAEKNEYSDVINSAEYVAETDNSEIIEKGGERVVDRPYVIPPAEFGELPDYGTISLTYYAADNVVTDEDDEIVDDVDEMIGLESLTHFGDYEDDSVFVRNDALRCDYEILSDIRSYAETHNTTSSTDQ